eukprot:CAMPEP_0179091976 /NCGR_PEP_ID=MMETSP0796-20121207/42043_1 /TAXON_ID=73915 /ORGANISM="Pyrodinium bahamense, Strain pbaha01" /LENGTH=57 /DNA_ID=CAMNT_0020789575 /DNA_START=30 /DNA_END=203 /DNA_ORIENTATION=+
MLPVEAPPARDQMFLGLQAKWAEAFVAGACERAICPPANRHARLRRTKDVLPRAHPA